MGTLPWPKQACDAGVFRRLERFMTVLAVLGSVGATIVALITIWNTAPVSRQRFRLQRAV